MSKGVYTVILGLEDTRMVRIGGLGRLKFNPGFYGYTGSARGRGGFNLESRISRYLESRIAKPFWHIDYFILGGASVKLVVYAETEDDFECKVASTLSEEAEVVERFGSSDCKGQCRGHLHFLGLNLDSALEKVESVYRRLGLNPTVKRFKG